MDQEVSLTENPPTDDRVPRLGIDRRRFMVRAAALGLTAAAFPAFLAACTQLDAEDALPLATPPDTPFPTPTPFTSAAVSPAPAATAIPQPSATPPVSAQAPAPTVPRFHDHPYPDASANHPTRHRHSCSNTNRTPRHRYRCPNTRPNRALRHGDACPDNNANPTASNSHTPSNPYPSPEV